MLQSPEYDAIKADYDKISSTHFPKSYFHPDDMRFAKSDALFPPASSLSEMTFSQRRINNLQTVRSP